MPRRALLCCVAALAPVLLCRISPVCAESCAEHRALKGLEGGSPVCQSDDEQPFCAEECVWAPHCKHKSVPASYNGRLFAAGYDGALVKCCRAANRKVKACYWRNARFGPVEGKADFAAADVMTSRNGHVYVWTCRYDSGDGSDCGGDDKADGDGDTGDAVRHAGNTAGDTGGSSSSAGNAGTSNTGSSGSSSSSSSSGSGGGSNDVGAFVAGEVARTVVMGLATALNEDALVGL